MLHYQAGAPSATTANVASGRPSPTAVFCDYACVGRPTPRGRCLQDDFVYDTQERDWLLLRTRADVAVKGLPKFLPEWQALSSGSMTWEGLFRIDRPPAQSRSMIMGTYGTNHDTGLYFIDATSRRRHGAVWLDTTGSLYLSTNVGTSSGVAVAPGNPGVDGTWHHIAAVFDREAGGAQVNFSMKINRVDLAKIQGIPGLEALFVSGIKQAVSLAADTGMEHVALRLEDAYRGGFWATRVYSMVNCAKDKAGAVRDRLAALSWLGHAVAEHVTAVPGIYSAVPAGLGVSITVNEISLPAMQLVGSAMLYVDGVRGSGTLTFVPEDDNIAMEGQMLLGGGHKGQAVACHASRIRFWSVALNLEQLRQLQQCELPGLPALIGGAWPHGLQAHYPLDVSLTNVAGTAFSALAASGTGDSARFARIGPCSVVSCPQTSPEGCLLAAGSERRFESAERCEAYSQWAHCRRAGASRGRPPHFTGC